MMLEKGRVPKACDLVPGLPCVAGWQQLHLTVDVLALGSMKTAAKRDIQWELQKHETHQVVERICGLGFTAYAH